MTNDSSPIVSLSDERLTNLNPRWVNISQWSNVHVGLTFDCPCQACNGPSASPQRLGVMFLPPIDPDNVMQEVIWQPSIAWSRTGDGFDDLTLSPSIDCSASGHWHGFVTSGKIQ